MAGAAVHEVVRIRGGARALIWEVVALDGDAAKILVRSEELSAPLRLRPCRRIPTA